MTPFACYQLYTSLKLHFTRDNYDYFKYNGTTKTSKDSFEARKDKFFFMKLSRNISKMEDMRNYFISNFLVGNVWIGQMTNEVYIQWKKKIESIEYNFSNQIETMLEKTYQSKLTFNDLFKCVNGQLPLIIKYHQWNIIDLECLIILDHLLSYSKQFEYQIAEPIIWNDLFTRMKKYSPFLKFDFPKLKTILIKKLEPYKNV